MVVGADIGYTFTKSISRAGNDIFRSTVQFDSIDTNKSIVISFNGDEYTVGERGQHSVSLNKIEDKTFNICLLSALARAVVKNQEDEIKLVTGLPIAYYARQKEQLRRSLESKRISARLNGQAVDGYISKCIVYPQSAGLFMVYPEEFKGELLVIDIGGMTVDVSQFDGTKLIKYATYPLGMLKLYSKAAQVINARDGEGIGIFEAEKAIRVGDVQKLVSAHYDEIHDAIKIDFHFNRMKKLYIGGGSIILGLTDSAADIFANAVSFYRIGCDKFGD